MDGRELRVQMARYGRPSEPFRRGPPRGRYDGGRSRRNWHRLRSMSISRSRSRSGSYQSYRSSSASSSSSSEISDNSSYRSRSKSLDPGQGQDRGGDPVLVQGGGTGDQGAGVDPTADPDLGVGAEAGAGVRAGQGADPNQHPAEKNLSTMMTTEEDSHPCDSN
ncbi:hypothetical protein FSP39_004633 [Pinctada imbricata]|uniref:Uncharacterized protein n=1 Tax=Pinctada imbricata TaxID=66713 RepID=A0AA88YIU1_PINIB|nr:hypothetical protein FSP39_004633 [Pinctada imbricata]